MRYIIDLAFLINVKRAVFVDIYMYNNTVYTGTVYFTCIIYLYFSIIGRHFASKMYDE